MHTYSNKASIVSVNVVVPQAAMAVFFHQGQVCIAASRLYVQSGIYDEFVKRAVEFAKKRKVGNPADPTMEQGPQVKKKKKIL